MRKFFGINENKYKFEIWDLTSLITVLNVTFIVMGMWWAPILGLVNCATCIILNIINHQSLIATKASRVCRAAGDDGDHQVFHGVFMHLRVGAAQQVREEVPCEKRRK